MFDPTTPRGPARSLTLLLLLPPLLLATATSAQDQGRTGKTQVAVTLDANTFTGVLSAGDVVLQDATATDTLAPGQHARFAGVSVSAVPERTALVVDGSQTYVFTHDDVGRASGVVPPTTTTMTTTDTDAGPLRPSSFAANTVAVAVLTGGGGGTLTVTPIPGSYVVRGGDTTTTFGAGDVATVAGATISALPSDRTGVVAHSLTFALAPASSSTASTGTAVQTTLLSGTRSLSLADDTTTAAASTSSAGSQQTGTSTSTAGANGRVMDGAQNSFVGRLATLIVMAFVSTVQSL